VHLRSGFQNLNTRRSFGGIYIYIYIKEVFESQKKQEGEKETYAWLVIVLCWR
jgi:hypothetical protein